MVRDSVLLLPRAWVQSLVKELKSQKTHGTAKKRNKNKYFKKESKFMPRKSVLYVFGACSECLLNSNLIYHDYMHA